MAQQVINIGSFLNDTSADTVPSAWTKVNAMMTELYAVAGGSPQLIPNVNTEKIRDGFVKVNTNTSYLYGAIGGTGRQAIDVGANYDLASADTVRSSFDKVNAMMAELYGLVTSVAYGPISQSQPSGSTVISPGSTSTQIQSAITAGTNTAVFWFPSGSYPVNSSLVPKTGQKFYGALGSVFDGTGWVNSNKSSGLFQGSGTGVHLINLTIRNCPARAVWGGGSGWLIEHCDIANNLHGINVSHNYIVRHCKIRGNIGNPTDPVFELRGGGYGGWNSTAALWEHNEFTGNGPEQKMAASRDCVMRNNWFHHNHQNAVWYDIDNIRGIVEDNLIEDNPGIGVFEEIGGSATVRNNIIRRNGQFGLVISSCSNVEAYGNWIQGSTSQAIRLHLDTRTGTIGSVNGTLYDTTNTNIHDNTIVITQGVATALAVSGIDATPYINNTKNNQFTANIYWVPNTTGSWWNWATNQTWSQWQARGFDLTGTRNVGTPP